MIFGEDETQPHGRPPQHQQQIRLDTASMETLYANFFALAGSPDEFTLYLGASSPLPGMREPLIKVSHRAMLLPANGKRLMLALQQAVKAHEDRFGPIELPPQQQPPQQ